jgi:hypothetical protein
MQKNLAIKNLFRLANGANVLACERSSSSAVWYDKKVRLVSESGAIVQEFVVAGERVMTHQSKQDDLIAIETFESVQITLEEAQSGRWHIEFMGVPGTLY